MDNVVKTGTEPEVAVTETKVVAAKDAPAATADVITSPAPSEPVSSVVVEKKSGGGAGKCFLIGCVVLLICCCVSVVGGYFLMQAGGAAVLSSKTTADETLTRLNSPEHVMAIIAEQEMNPKTGVEIDSSTTSFTYTEEEVLAYLVSAMKLQEDPGKVGLKIEDDSAKLEMELAALAEVIESASEDGSVEMTVSGLEGAFASISLAETTDGAGLIVTDVSLGNGLADIILKDVVKQSLNSMIEQSLADGFGQGLKGLELGDGEVTLLMDPDYATTNTYPADGEDMLLDESDDYLYR